MTCTADAPVPMMATRLPARSCAWSQRAVCMVTPAKSPTPSMSGSFGSVSTPAALMRNRPVISPVSVATRHMSASASKAAPVTAVLNRIRSAMPYLATQ